MAMFLGRWVTISRANNVNVEGVGPNWRAANSTRGVITAVPYFTFHPKNNRIKWEDDFITEIALSEVAN